MAIKIRQQGFTLTELAIAFFIIGLLLASAFMPLSSQLEVRNIADTRRTMEQIREAMIGYAQMNGRLPCPAAGNIASGGAGAGVEQNSGTACTTLIGVVPWSTLGVPEVDAWGRRFTYRVSSVFSDDQGQNTWNTSNPSFTLPNNQTSTLDCTAPSPTPSISFALCSLGEIAVIQRSINVNTSAHETSALGTGLAAVFVSHGRNGYGGWQSNGIQLSGTTANTDEHANTTTWQSTASAVGAPGSGNNYSSYLFYSRDYAPFNSNCNEANTGQPLCEYDDIVVMLTANSLVARMISAGKLP